MLKRKGKKVKQEVVVIDVCTVNTVDEFQQRATLEGKVLNQYIKTSKR